MIHTRRTPPTTSDSTETLQLSPTHEIAESADNPSKKRKGDNIDLINLGECNDKAMEESLRLMIEDMGKRINRNVTNEMGNVGVKIDRVKQEIGTVSKKLDQVDRKVDEVELKVDEMRDEVNQKIAHIHEKLTETNDRVAKKSDDVTNINWKLNELEQMNLATRMDITGVHEEQLTGDIKSVAISVIQSCGITTIKPADITSAFARKPKGYDKPIITAIFASADRANPKS